MRAAIAQAIGNMNRIRIFFLLVGALPLAQALRQCSAAVRRATTPGDTARPKAEARPRRVRCSVPYHPQGSAAAARSSGCCRRRRRSARSPSERCRPAARGPAPAGAGRPKPARCPAGWASGGTRMAAPLQQAQPSDPLGIFSRSGTVGIRHSEAGTLEIAIEFLRGPRHGGTLLHESSGRPAMTTSGWTGRRTGTRRPGSTTCRTSTCTSTGSARPSGTASCGRPPSSRRRWPARPRTGTCRPGSGGARASRAWGSTGAWRTRPRGPRGSRSRGSWSSAPTTGG
jgi:hypothetical protein